MAARTTPLVSPPAYWLIQAMGLVLISTIVEYVNVLCFLAGHRLDDLWNNYSPGINWKTGRRVEARERCASAVQYSIVVRCVIATP